MGKFFPVLVEFDKLRYKFLPYIYSMSGQVFKENYTMMRALVMDFSDDEKVYDIKDEYMFGSEVLVAPVTDFMYHTPPEISKLVPKEVFKNGVNVKYYKDKDFKQLSKEETAANIDIYWYDGRPDFVTDSMYSVRWEGKIVVPESGKYQFQIKSFDSRLIIFNGDTLKVQLAGNEPYYEFINLEKGKEYPIICETVNHQTGAARFRLFWKTPTDFARENQKSTQKQSRSVYLPKGSDWTEFFSGKTYRGGKSYEIACPIDRIPIFLKTGSIIPMTPGITRAEQSQTAPLEILIYPGADGSYTLYEDAGDGYGYENGEFSKIRFTWDNANSTLTIHPREGSFPGMRQVREIRVIVAAGQFDADFKNVPASKIVKYSGEKVEVKVDGVNPRQ
jgi:alpha-D-xyloside xylohydrolase